MHYIIESATIIDGKKVREKSLLVKNNEISYIGDDVSMFSAMKMDIKSFVLTPSFVMFAPNIPTDSFYQFKEHFVKRLLSKGCGTIITEFSINYDFEFEEKLLEKRTSLLNSPLDYILGVRIPASKINTTIIKKCKVAKIPLIFVEINDVKELKALPWGWLKEASYPYNPVLIPVFPSYMKHSIQKKTCKYWAKLLEKEKLSHLPQPLPSYEPLDEFEIKKIGLYPKRGLLRTGSEINYNLFFKNSRVEHPKTLYYDNLKLAVAVQKGKFAFIDKKPFFRPGYGEELMINQTALFV
ncbi:hypothetical protein [Lederbergia lenta]|uniref:Uncharacterized protein n=1 Tax=Lederbergia lenta TaxID=1467 RepID=A0A2X4VX18_LEDLE|nr:hypothetical protein [Lederbergia lenta]MEC2324958.1 hypothetical protein [Lederbergia lenta]SQI56546.1 Uncharacterised protein [Lederbergia lenta]